MSLVLDKIKNEKNRIYIWGIGDVSSIISDLLLKSNIEVSGYIVDNTDKTEYRGKKIYKFDDEILLSGYALVVGHSKYHLADEIVKKYPAIQKIYCLCDISFASNINSDYFGKHSREVKMVYECLSDEWSRNIFSAYQKSIVEDDFRYMLPFVDKNITYFNNDIWTIGTNENYIDVGAYDGDTIKDFLEYSNNQYHSIMAFEPDILNYNRLKHFVRNLHYPKISYYNIAIGLKDGYCECYTSGTQESSIVEIEQGSTRIYSLDTICKNSFATFIKINIPNSKNVILGGKDIINKYQPKLVISAGFDVSCMVQLPIVFSRLFKNYKVFLRTNTAMPQKVILLATPDLIKIQG